MAGEEIEIKVLEAALSSSLKGKKGLQAYRTDKENCPGCSISETNACWFFFFVLKEWPPL